MMRRRRKLSVWQLRMALITILVVQFPNLIFILSSQILASADDDSTQSQNYQDIDFSNITLLDMLARKYMEKIHGELDRDDDGNVSISEGAKYIDGGDFEKPSGKTNLPGFETDKDGRITAAEFWETWVRSSVHNWTAIQMVDWLAFDVDLPQYAHKFRQYKIPGAAMPILASNGTLALSLVDGVRKHRRIMWLKALEVVLCGHSPMKSSVVKDVLMTISLMLALSGIAFGVHVRRCANLTVLQMQDKLTSLQKEMQKVEDDDLVWMKQINPESSGENEGSSLGTKGSECSSSNASLASEVSIHTRLSDVLEELKETKISLEQAEEQLKLSTNNWIPPGRLLRHLMHTYAVESKLHEVKRIQAQKQVEQAKVQFLKVKKKWPIFSSVPLINSRQMDTFDVEVQQAKSALKEVQIDSKEHRRRWLDIESICKCKIISQQWSATAKQRQIARKSSQESLTPSIAATVVSGQHSAAEDVGMSMSRAHSDLDSCE